MLIFFSFVWVIGFRKIFSIRRIQFSNCERKTFHYISIVWDFQSYCFQRLFIRKKSYFVFIFLCIFWMVILNPTHKWIIIQIRLYFIKKKKIKIKYRRKVNIYSLKLLLTQTNIFEKKVSILSLINGKKISISWKWLKYIILPFSQHSNMQDVSPSLCVKYNGNTYPHTHT